MKRIAYAVAVICIAPTGIVTAQNCQSTDCVPTKKGGIDAKTQKILAQFANIVLGFLGIVQDPKNATNVKDRVTEMVNNAVNIVTEAVKKGELSLDATEEEVEMFAKEAIRKKLIVIE
jgi:uncharacterized membrane protein